MAANPSLLSHGGNLLGLDNAAKETVSQMEHKVREMTNSETTAPNDGMNHTNLLSAAADGLHCVYVTCQGLPHYPRPCHPGCYFQMTAVSELEIMRRLMEDKNVES